MFGLHKRKDLLSSYAVHRRAAYGTVPCSVGRTSHNGYLAFTFNDPGAAKTHSVQEINHSIYRSTVRTVPVPGESVYYSLRPTQQDVSRQRGNCNTLNRTCFHARKIDRVDDTLSLAIP